MKTHINTPELKATISSLYLQDGLPPRVIAERLRTDHGADIPDTALRQWLRRSGCTAKRKVIDAELETSLDTAKIAAIRHGRARDSLSRWADKSEAVVDKALDAATTSDRLRDLSVATSTAAQAVRIFQMCSGIGSEATAARVTFDFNFARGPGSPFFTGRSVTEVESTLVEVDADDEDETSDVSPQLEVTPTEQNPQNIGS